MKSQLKLGNKETKKYNKVIETLNKEKSNKKLRKT